MTRLHVHVEGQTEELFVNNLLAGHLGGFGYTSVTARLIGNARQRSHRGGSRSWEGVRKEIVRHLKQDAGVQSTLMVDYYALPHTWPGRAEADGAPFAVKGPLVEQRLHADIVAEMGSGFDPRRFLPFVLMHEFEGLLFSDCMQLAHVLGAPAIAVPLQNIRNAYDTPEQINDGVTTAPSKRILQLHARYQKLIDGYGAVAAIGLETIREQCPGFGHWINRLEAQPALLAGTAAP